MKIISDLRSLMAVDIPQLCSHLSSVTGEHFCFMYLIYWFGFNIQKIKFVLWTCESSGSPTAS